MPLLFIASTCMLQNARSAIGVAPVRVARLVEALEGGGQ
jgi:hypothetical protein